MTWAGAPGSIGITGPGVDVGGGHRLPHQDDRRPIRVVEGIHATPSTDSENQTGQVRSR
jgi:hypothetical protein